jgi:ketosteroid isomerase-like protein
MNQQATKGDTAETREILAHHLECFGKLDLAGTMTDYADESRFFSHGGVLHGSDSIRKFYGTLFEEFEKPGMSFDLLQQEVDDDTAYIVWKAETADNSSKSAPTPSS